MLPDATRLPTLETPRLRIRAIAETDVPALFSIFGDAEVCRYWSHPPLRDLAAAAEYQRNVERHFAARTLFQWAIEARAGGGVVGTCTLAALSSEHRRAEVGYALARRAWGRGLAAESLHALLAFAFGTLRLHRVEADVDPRNTRSVRTLTRLGFRREGYLRERYHVAGEVQDAELYGLLAREWPVERAP